MGVHGIRITIRSGDHEVSFAILNIHITPTPNRFELEKGEVKECIT